MQTTPCKVFKFWSDIAYQKFNEALDMRHPSNLFEADPVESTVQFFSEPSHQVVKLANQLGATEEEPE